MKVQLDKTFPLPSTPAIAWEFLQDVEAVAACMPGAQITERVDENRHKGTVKVRVGPATMSFRGEVEVQDIDPTTQSLRLIGKGTDSTGNSGVTMNLLARIDAVDGGLCELVGSSEVSMSGRLAAFGGRLMNSVADKILLQFADNFAAEVAALQEQHSGSAVAGDDEPTMVAPASRAKELNALALGWAVFMDWLRGLFAKKRA
ncbi:MAG: SRPBCC family protein [Proteobacteria bacterium]|nr:SRPBCC family protein [Pseudomonadota bacterium]